MFHDVLSEKVLKMCSSSAIHPSRKVADTHHLAESSTLKISACLKKKVLNSANSTFLKFWCHARTATQPH